MTNDTKDRRPPSARPKAPTLDRAEQGSRSLEFMDRVYDDAQDEAVDANHRPGATAHRLAATAKEMVDDLPRRIAAGRRRQPTAEAAMVEDRPLPILTPPPVVASVQVASPDTARIARMSRVELEGLVTQLHHQRGDTPLVTYEGVADDDLRAMARSLRA